MSGCANLGTCGGNKTVTVTQTMINNGGFVMVAREASFGQQVRRGEWITLEAPAIVLSRSAALPVAEGSSATYTVKIRVASHGEREGESGQRQPGSKGEDGDRDRRFHA